MRSIIAMDSLTRIWIESPSSVYVGGPLDEMAFVGLWSKHHVSKTHVIPDLGTWDQIPGLILGFTHMTAIAATLKYEKEQN